MIERIGNKYMRNYTIVIAVVAIFSMMFNLYLCKRTLDTVDRIMAASPRVYVTREKEIEVVEEDVEEIVEEVQQIESTEEVIEENVEEIKEDVKEDAKANPTPIPAEGVLTKSKGTVQFDGHKETYYNLNMSKVVSNAKKKIQAAQDENWEYWEREDGAKMLGDYIMVAADQKIHPYGSLVNTSLGMGIVVDTGTFIQTNPQQIDIAVTW